MTESVRDPVRSADEVRAWLIARLAASLNVDPALLDSAEELAAYGLDSLAAVEVATELGQWLGGPLPDDLLWSHPSIDKVVEALVQQRSCVTPPPSVSPG